MNKLTRGLILMVCASAGLQAGPLAYLTTIQGEFGTLDLGNGHFSLISTGSLLDGLGAIGNTLYGLGPTGTLFQIDPLTGARTTLGTSSHSFNAFGSTLTGLFAVDNSVNVYSINATNGSATLLGPTGFSFGAVDSLTTNSATLYWADGTNLYTINISTGAATLVGPTGGAQLGAMVLESGTLWGGMFLPSALVSTVNPLTGAVTGGPALTGPLGSFYGLAPDPLGATTAPEPETMLLLALGIGAILLRRQRPEGQEA